MKGVKLKLNLETVNCVLLVVILVLVIYCVVKQNENFTTNAELNAAETNRLDAQVQARRRFVCRDLDGTTNNMKQKCEQSEGCRFIDHGDRLPKKGKCNREWGCCRGRSAKVIQDGKNIIQFGSIAAASARRGKHADKEAGSGGGSNPGAQGNAEDQRGLTQDMGSELDLFDLRDSRQRANAGNNQRVLTSGRLVGSLDKWG